MLRLQYLTSVLCLAQLTAEDLLTSGSQTRPLAPQTTPMPTDTMLNVSSTDLTFSNSLFHLWAMTVVAKYLALLQVCGLSTPARGATSTCTSWTSTLKWPTTLWRCGTARGQTPFYWVRICNLPTVPFDWSTSWERDLITFLLLFFQLSSPETKAPPMICIQQPIRCQCGLSQTNQDTAEGSVQTLPLVSAWGCQVGGMSSDGITVHLFFIVTY